VDSFAIIPVFTTVVELGSFSQAAIRLGITKSAVSKQISALEKHLGIQLIQRTTRKLSLTEAGEQYYSYISKAKMLVDEADDAVDSFRGTPKGLLRVSIPMVFGRLHVAPLISEFLDLYPQISLHLSLDDKVVNIQEQGLDMVLRIGDLPDSSLVASKLSPCRSVMCASPEYLKKFGVPQTPEALKEHNCLFYSYFRAGVEWTFTGPEGTCSIRPHGNVQVNNSEVLQQLLLDGVGICQMPLFIVADDLAGGHLQAVLPDYRLPEHGIYAIYPQRAFMPSKLRVFLQFLQSKLITKSACW